MASEIRVNKLNSQTGVGTITLSPTGVDISGVTTVSTLKVGTGVTASEDGDIFFTGIITGNGSGLSNVGVDTAVVFTDKLGLGDNERVSLGIGSDLNIYHDGTDNYVAAANGHLNILGDGSNEIHMKAIYNKESLIAVPSGAVTLYHNNSAKLATSASGVSVTGTVAATDYTGSGASLTQIPAANIVGVATGGFKKSGETSLQVLEQFITPADGSSFTTSNGTVTVENPSDWQALTTTLADVQGSSITYTPPTGTTLVIYEFQYAIASDTDSNAILGGRLLIDGTEVTHSRFGQRGGTNYFDQLNTFKWGINIGGSADTAVGRLASWTSNKTVKLQMMEHSSDYEFAINLLRNYGSTGAINVFRRPVIGITAIGTLS